MSCLSIVRDSFKTLASTPSASSTLPVLLCCPAEFNASLSLLRGLAVRIRKGGRYVCRQIERFGCEDGLLHFKVCLPAAGRLVLQ